MSDNKLWILFKIRSWLGKFSHIRYLEGLKTQSNQVTSVGELLGLSLEGLKTQSYQSEFPQKKIVEIPGLSRTFQDHFSNFPGHLLYLFQDFSRIFQKMVVISRTSQDMW